LPDPTGGEDVSIPMTMRNPLLAVLLLAIACNRSAPNPAGETAAAPQSADAHESAELRAAREELTRPLELHPSGHKVDPAAEPRVLQLHVERDRVEVDGTGGARKTVPFVGGAVDGAAVAAAIGTDAYDGGAIVVLADDAPYQALVTAMDTAKRQGISDIGIESPDDSSDASAAAAPPTVTPSPEETPIVIISTTDITLRLPKSAARRDVSIGTVADVLAQAGQDIPALRTAVGALSPHPDMAILQADQATPGAVFNRAFRTLKRLGVDNVLLAIKDKK
jgi:biopolymer transport protein ExbD